MPDRDDDLARAVGPGPPDRRRAERQTPPTVPTLEPDSFLTRMLANPATRGGYALVASSAITSIVGVVFWWVGARWWSSAELGRGAALIAAMALVAELATLGMSSGLVRFLPQAGRGSAQLIKQTYAVAVALAVVLGTIAVLTLDVVAAEIGALGTGWSIWFVLACCSWCVFALQDGALVGLGRATTVPVENFVFAIAKLVALIVLASVATGEALFLAWSAPTFGAVAVIAWLIFRRYAPRGSAPAAPEALFATTLRYSVLNQAASMLQRATPLLLPLLVISTRGASASSYYYVAWTSAYTLYLVSNNIGDALVAEASRRPSELAKYTGTSLRHSLGVVAVGAAGAVVVAPWFLQLFGTEYSDNSAVLLRLLAIAAVPNAVTTIYISVLRSQSLLGRVAVVQGLMGLPTLALAIPVLEGSGLTGLGVLWLVNQIAVAVCVVIVGFRSGWTSTPSSEAPSPARVGSDVR